MMDDAELKLLEAELMQLQPSAPRPELLRRLSGAMPPPVQAPGEGSWLAFLKWAVPAMVAAVAILGATAVLWSPAPGHDVVGGNPATPALHADEVAIERQLVSSFQTVADSAEGLPIRFELQEWRERIIFRDTRRGVTVEKTTPRIEIVPVKYESY